MASFCMFGSHGGQLGPAGGVHITIFGASELLRPPVARQIIDRREEVHKRRSRPMQVLVTLFGAAGVRWPTLAEEYLVLREALRSGDLTLDDWDRYIGGAIGTELPGIHPVTLCGTFNADGLPEDEEELDALAMQQHLGHLSEQTVAFLTMAVGQRGAQRLTAVRHALSAELVEAA